MRVKLNLENSLRSETELYALQTWKIRNSLAFGGCLYLYFALFLVHNCLHYLQLLELCNMTEIM